MKKAIAVILAIAVVLMGLAACGKTNETTQTMTDAQETATQANENGKELPEAHVCDGFDAQTEAELLAISQTYQPVAVQFALLDGNTIKSFCYGYADLESGSTLTDETKYRAASLSKLASAVVFMEAKERGFVDEETDISDYFGESCRNPYYPQTVITSSMLMTHTASLDIEGYSSYYSGMLNETGCYLRTEPGAAYEYSNLGYGVLSCALERACGLPFNTMAREWVFTPMGIDASFVYSELTDTSDVGALYGENGGLSIAELEDRTGKGFGTDLTLACGNLIISAKDYVKLLGVLIHDGADVNGTKILSQESVASLLKERFQTETFGVAFGSQIQTNLIEGQTVYVHTGSAYGMFSAYVFDPATKRAVVAFTVGEDRYMDSESEVYYLCQDFFRAVW